MKKQPPMNNKKQPSLGSIRTEENEAREPSDLHDESESMDPTLLNIVRQRSNAREEGESLKLGDAASLQGASGVSKPSKKADDLVCVGVEAEEGLPGAFAMGGPGSAPTEIQQLDDLQDVEATAEGVEASIPTATAPVCSADDGCWGYSNRSSSREGDLSKSLTEATLITEGSGVEHQQSPLSLPVAQPTDAATSKKKRSQSGGHDGISHKEVQRLAAGIIGIVCALVLAVVGMAVALAKRASSHHGPQASSQATGDPELGIREAVFRDRLAYALQEVRATNALDETTSAQAKAFHWILEEDPLQLPAEGDFQLFLERFALAEFYFATTAEGPWVNCNPNVNNNQKEVGHNASSSLCYYQANLAGIFSSGGVQAYTHLQQTHGEVRAARWLSGHGQCQWAGLYCNQQGKVEILQLEEMDQHLLSPFLGISNS